MEREVNSWDTANIADGERTGLSGGYPVLSVDLAQAREA
jgi:hypothetical protein